MPKFFFSYKNFWNGKCKVTFNVLPRSWKREGLLISNYLFFPYISITVFYSRLLKLKTFKILLKHALEDDGMSFPYKPCLLKSFAHFFTKKNLSLNYLSINTAQKIFSALSFKFIFYFGSWDSKESLKLQSVMKLFFFMDTELGQFSYNRKQRL